MRQVTTILIVFLICGESLCQEKSYPQVGYYSYPLDHLDSNGHPNLMRVIFDDSYYSSELSETEIEKLKEVRAGIRGARKFLKRTTVHIDGVEYESAILHSPEKLHAGLKDELNLMFGPEFAQRVANFCYRNFVSERSLEELVKFPSIANAIELDDQELKQAIKRSKALNEQVEAKTRRVLEKAFREVLGTLGTDRKKLLLKRLGLATDNEDVPDWALHSIVRNSSPQYQFLLMPRRLNVDQEIFDYSWFFKKALVTEYLELIDDQRAEIKAAQKLWSENQDLNRVARNGRLERILLPEQFELLNDLAYREVYFRGDIVNFFNNQFIRKQLRLHGPESRKMIDRIDAISNTATKLRSQMIRTNDETIISFLDRNTATKLKQLLGDD